MKTILSEGVTIFFAEDEARGWFGPPTKIVDNATGYEFDPEHVKSADFLILSDATATDPGVVTKLIRISIELEAEVEHKENAIEVETISDGVIRYDKYGIRHV